MSEALRYNKDKMNWVILDGYFKDAQEAEYYCREYGVQKYTVPEKGIDGLTNWMASMGTPKHDEFMYGCLESANRHLLQLRRGEQIDEESGKPHVGFVRLNMGMYQAYWKYKEAHVPETAFVNTTNVKCPNIKRRDEMPRWLIELICERCRDGLADHNLVISMFGWGSHEGCKFWSQVNNWQNGIGELPERPSK